MVASQAPPTVDLALNPGMCPDWELNQRPFGSQVDHPVSHTSQGWFESFKKEKMSVINQVSDALIKQS